ncbi:NUDIX domain-containing protein [Undibacterium terreum]|uniref:Nudix hydrolase domain-containing protein n=1 Tax=Undibacterium terreum TaxID=1224302 RepID=A0A916XJ87_9BURK|nr:NUDIX domain-containing protein [Undibacterium terreum]GGC77482.1 hypothetical protein GCM10011396_25810 [Undibacterium terreum]
MTEQDFAASDEWSNCVAALAAHFHSEASVFGLYKALPQLQTTGAFPFPPELQEDAERHRERLHKLQRPNEWHALLQSPMAAGQLPATLNLQTLDFAGICALREHGHKPAIVSTCAVLVCAERREILLHRRSLDSATEPGALHTIGGAYTPRIRQADQGPADIHGLLDTVRREIAEETSLRLAISPLPPVLCLQELASGFIQYAFLGVPVAANAMDALQSNWEGSIARVRFDDLRELLAAPGWVASGKLHVLAWLSLGAPGAGSGSKFGGLGAQELFRSAIRP